ncbi:MAG TPA: aminotransferase class I/II-fold pyridoxal phosphate-dependent enzyme [Minicystis sp.]|nr:aminotransferase class I/II-fold pyridoxal phosphate-dependent enzyme [Minicystis sp.]
METSEYLASVETLHEEARRRGLFFLTCEDAALEGRTVTIGERRVVSFSSCSYLGLERHPRLIAGVHDAVDRYGTQFSSSRGYLSAPPYARLEALLSELFGGHALVTSSTTLGHQVALGVLATEKDAIVLDHQVHHSVHMAATLARAGGTQVEIVKHGELEKALDVVARFAKRCRTVWFSCDGVFSMYGDLAPIGLLERILAVAPNVRLYVDDAHGMSWAGEHGRGSFLSRMPPVGERLVLATSLNKAFSAAGGCLVFPTAAERDRVRMAGGPMVFSGPVQPPMLGAAIASAEVHLSPEIDERQRALAERTSLANRMLRSAALPLLVENESPIFFLRTGLPRAAFRIAERMLEDGLYVNVSTYPSVPMKRAGIRLTLTAAHELADVARVVERLAEHVPGVLAEEGVNMADLDGQFATALPRDRRAAIDGERVSRKAALLELAGVEVTPESGERRRRRDSGVELVDGSELVVETFRTIGDVDKATWDAHLGAAGACSWDAMALAERVFSNQPRREHNWEFLYVLVRDGGGELVAATFFTTALAKDDFLMRDEVSRAVEARRKDDPYFLTSVVVSMGSMLSEGNHLFLDRGGPWRQALARVLEVANAEVDRANATVLLVRDLPADDPEMDAFLLDQGLVKVPMLDSHVLRIDWKDQAGFLASLDRRKRKALREVVEAAPRFRVEVHAPGAPMSCERASKLYELYRNVASRKLRLNVFALPESLVSAIAASPAWEIVTLHLPPAHGGPEDGAPVAWFAAHVHAGHYTPFFCGLDYRFVFQHGAYRQLILQMIGRATERGASVVHMGMDADAEKHRFGSEARATAVYVEARDHYSGQILREIVAEVGVARRAS